jgi:SpoVK/Ycf46/Vps4 family AAA+-type ATPase
LAGTLSIPFFTVKIADILSDREQASTLLNDRFKEAQAATKNDNGGVAILFIDECDELLQAREHAPEYIAPIAFNLRTILSGFDATYNRVVLIVATNNPPDRLDGTLLRSGRFNYKIHIHYPTFEERAAVIAYHATERHLAIDGAFITLLAERTERLSKSDLVMLIDKGTAEANAHDMPLQKALLDELEKIQETQSVRESASQTEDIPALKTWRTLWL